MKELIIHLAASLATRPEEVSVTEGPRDKEPGAVLELRVAPEDLTHVIGKHGRTARAMRSLLSAAGAKTGERCFLKIMSGDQPAEPAAHLQEDAPA